MSRARLYGVRYSPWTERARWALDHHGVGYRYHEHVPLLGERLLRFRARHADVGTVSVPLLIDDSGSYGDSVEIIERADVVADGAPLVRDREATRALRERIDVGLDAARARVTARVLADPEALRESAMVVSPPLFASLLRPVAAQGARYIARKYGADLDADHLTPMRGTLEEIRARLDGGRHLEPAGFGALDILAATFLQAVRPVEQAYIPLGPALRRAWTCEELAGPFEDLLRWRDVIYAAHRRAG